MSRTMESIVSADRCGQEIFEKMALARSWISTHWGSSAVHAMTAGEVSSQKIWLDFFLSISIHSRQSCQFLEQVFSLTLLAIRHARFRGRLLIGEISLFES